jgi:hypothetical protein
MENNEDPRRGAKRLRESARVRDDDAVARVRGTIKEFRLMMELLPETRGEIFNVLSPSDMSNLTDAVRVFGDMAVLTLKKQISLHFAEFMVMLENYTGERNIDVDLFSMLAERFRLTRATVRGLLPIQNETKVSISKLETACSEMIGDDSTSPIVKVLADRIANALASYQKRVDENRRRGNHRYPPLRSKESPDVDVPLSFVDLAALIGDIACPHPDWSKPLYPMFARDLLLFLADARVQKILPNEGKKLHRFIPWVFQCAIDSDGGAGSFINSTNVQDLWVYMRSLPNLKPSYLELLNPDDVRLRLIVIPNASLPRWNVHRQEVYRLLRSTPELQRSVIDVLTAQCAQLPLQYFHPLGGNDKLTLGWWAESQLERVNIASLLFDTPQKLWALVKEETTPLFDFKDIGHARMCIIDPLRAFVYNSTLDDFSSTIDPIWANFDPETALPGMFVHDVVLMPYLEKVLAALAYEREMEKKNRQQAAHHLRMQRDVIESIPFYIFRCILPRMRVDLLHAYPTKRDRARFPAAYQGGFFLLPPMRPGFDDAALTEIADLFQQVTAGADDDEDEVSDAEVRPAGHASTQRRLVFSDDKSDEKESDEESWEKGWH